jgi:hypothetical protein
VISVGDCLLCDVADDQPLPLHMGSPPTSKTAKRGIPENPPTPPRGQQRGGRNLHRPQDAGKMGHRRRGRG